MSADPELVRKIKSALTRDTRVNLDLSELAIDEEGGAVSLSGTVPSVAAIRRAVRLTEEVTGVKNIENRLRIPVVTSMGATELNQRLRNALIQERNIEEDHIEIDTSRDGDVLLRGSVHSLVQRRLCEVLCWWSPGVASVRNLIVVSPPDQDTDEELKDNLEIILEKDPMVDPKKFHTEVHDAKVTLRGQVNSETEKDAAERDCWYTPGVVEVANELTIR